MSRNPWYFGVFSKHSNILPHNHIRVNKVKKMNSDTLLPPNPHTTLTFALKIERSTSEPPVGFSCRISLFSTILEKFLSLSLSFMTLAV